MKVLFFGGGLGNQIFCYAFYIWCKNAFKNEKILLVCDNHKMNEHYGLEIDKWFDVCIKPSFCGKLIYYFAYFMRNIFHYNNFMDLDTRKLGNPHAVVYNAFKYTKEYLPSNPDWLKWRVAERSLSQENVNVLNLIKNTESCFIHVRRGDFLSPRYKELYDGCCNEEYYHNAIDFFTKSRNIPGLIYYVFSDDMEWCKEKLDVPKDRTHFITWNVGNNSAIDMFLMSNCKYAIIANSTFSFWGASLNRIKDIVIYPKKWINKNYVTPDIFPNSWIGL